MGKFVSMNYTRVTCGGCGEVTTIEPGREFKQLECSCNTEVSKQFKEIKVAYHKQDGSIIEVIGQFKNGDLEIKREDSNLSYRITQEDFDNHFNYEAKKDLTIEDIIGKINDEIKAAYTVEELRLLARSLKIRGASQMNEDNLVSSLVEHAKDR